MYQNIALYQRGCGRNPVHKTLIRAVLVDALSVIIIFRIAISLQTQTKSICIATDRRILKDRVFRLLRIVDPVAFLSEAEEVQHGH